MENANIYCNREYLNKEEAVAFAKDLTGIDIKPHTLQVWSCGMRPKINSYKFGSSRLWRIDELREFVKGTKNFSYKEIKRKVAL